MKLNRFFTFLFFVLSSFCIADENKILLDSANSNYSKNNFEKAIEYYNSLLNKGVEAPEVYFNLGNAFYKSDKIGFAILNFEKAKKLKPEDEDINENLKIANQKTEDKIDVAPQLFLTEWKNGIVDLLSENNWSVLCIILFILTCVGFALFYSSVSLILKKISFFSASVFLLLSVSTYFIAKHKYQLTIASKEAIITSATATITGSPNSKGTKLFMLHEGTKVSILGNQDEWTEIKIANGNVGWIPTNSISSI